MKVANHPKDVVCDVIVLMTQTKLHSFIGFAINIARIVRNAIWLASPFTARMRTSRANDLKK